MASWASCPARGFRPSYDRPTALTSADPSGVSMFRTRETRPGPGALYTPGTAVPARPRVRPVTAACRLATAGPCHPGAATRPGMSSLTRHQQGFTGVRPSRPFSSPVAPGRNGDPWAFPRASHRAEQDPAKHAGAGTGLRHWPGVTSSPPATSLDALTHSERPHVATHLRGVLSSETSEASATPIVPAKRAPFALARPNAHSITRWIEAKHLSMGRSVLASVTICS